jgi:flagellin
MGFRINTNIAAMDAHRNAMMTNQGLDKSLGSLSSGLRINKAADDASGMTIADSLRSQAQGLGQAINNANDGVAVVQTADGALDEYIKIINSVRTKSIQAASDGQNADSRGAIQNDITRLLQEANNIAKTTQFNGQKLLDGTFTNKSFHIGAYANETVDLSVGNTQTDSIGEVLSVTGVGTWNAAIDVTGDAASLEGQSNGAYGLANVLTINGTDITNTLNSTSPNDLLSAKNVAIAISQATDLAAAAKTELTGGAITIDATDDSAEKITINGYSIGSVSWAANDGTGSLTKAINDISSFTGVTAAIENNVLKLTAEDGRNIAINEVTAGAAGSLLTAAGLTNTTTSVAGATAVAALVSTYSTAALTLNAGDLVINGVDLAGVYGAASSADSVRTELEAAIKNIDGLSGSSISTLGTTTLFRDDGGDINVKGSATTYFANTSQGIFNDSTKGDVTVYTEGLLAVTGTTNTIGFTTGNFTPVASETLSTIDVTTRESAEVGILIADSALKALDATRSDLGSVQNQLESTIRNISVTQVNVTAAESQIRDVDFASESANFAKLNILAQSGSYAMSQANAVQQNVMRLLQ